MRSDPIGHNIHERRTGLYLEKSFCLPRFLEMPSSGQALRIFCASMTSMTSMISLSAQ
jgi:hypothetical protein